MRIDLFNRLRKYENYLYTAQKADYIRSLTAKEVEDIISIAKEIGIGYKHNGCGLCLLKFIKKVAEPYFQQQEKMENNRKNKKKENNDDN